MRSNRSATEHDSGTFRGLRSPRACGRGSVGSPLLRSAVRAYALGWSRLIQPRQRLIALFVCLEMLLGGFRPVGEAPSISVHRTAESPSRWGRCPLPPQAPLGAANGTLRCRPRRRSALRRWPQHVNAPATFPSRAPRTDAQGLRLPLHDQRFTPTANLNSAQPLVLSVMCHQRWSRRAESPGRCWTRFWRRRRSRGLCSGRSPRVHPELLRRCGG